MRIETKKELKDKVWVLHKEKIKHLNIVSISVNISNEILPLDINEYYNLRDEKNKFVDLFHENKCFDTKEQLLKSLEA